MYKIILKNKKINYESMIKILSKKFKTDKNTIKTKIIADGLKFFITDSYKFSFGYYIFEKSTINLKYIYGI